jgi:hypothetical protein
MPSNMTEERRAAMAAYGATLINVPAGKMELARDMALDMQVCSNLEFAAEKIRFCFQAVLCCLDCGWVVAGRQISSEAGLSGFHLLMQDPASCLDAGKLRWPVCFI